LRDGGDQLERAAAIWAMFPVDIEYLPEQFDLGEKAYSCPPSAAAFGREEPVTDALFCCRSQLKQSH